MSADRATNPSAEGETLNTAEGEQRVRRAVLDEAHLGDIHGALGTIRMDDDAPRLTVSARLRTFWRSSVPG
jgi:hypothetical protein